jgi:hypothetical protein
LLELAAELLRAGDAQARQWSASLAPLTSSFVGRYLAYLPKVRYPIRYGIHRTAHSVSRSRSTTRKHPGKKRSNRCASIRRTAGSLADRDAPAAWETFGRRFPFAGVDRSVADVARDARERIRGVARELSFPAIVERRPSTLFTPAHVADRTDPQIVHLDGLNLSRAWCMRGIAHALRDGDARTTVLRDAAEAHFAAGMTGIDQRRVRRRSLARELRAAGSGSVNSRPP